MAKPQVRKRTKKVAPTLPEGFPAVGTYVSYYWEGWRHGIMEATDGHTATIRISERRSRKIPLNDVEIPAPKEGAPDAPAPTQKDAHPAPKNSLAKVPRTKGHHSRCDRTDYVRG